MLLLPAEDLLLEETLKHRCCQKNQPPKRHLALEGSWVTSAQPGHPYAPPPLMPGQEGTHIAFAIAGVGKAPRTL